MLVKINQNPPKTGTVIGSLPVITGSEFHIHAVATQESLAVQWNINV